MPQPSPSRLRIVQTLLLVASSSCTGEGGQATRHPTTTNVPSSPIVWSEAEHGRDFLHERTNSIGAVTQPVEEVFGLIRDVASDSAGRLYVLDSRFNEIRVFSSEGTFLGTAGGPGSGPGEFQHPEAIEILEDQSVLVADRGGRIKLLNPLSCGLSERASILLDFAPESMCVLEDQVFLRGWTADQAPIIHAADLEGSITFSFGAAYESLSALVSWRLSSGSIACVPETNTIVELSLRLPFVRGYSDKGELLWVAEIPGFRQMEIWEDARGGIGLRAGVEHELGLSAVPLRGGRVLVQTQRQVQEGESRTARVTEIRTFLVDAADGSGQMISSNLPIIVATAGSNMVGVQQVPFPQLTIWEGPAESDHGLMLEEVGR